MSEIFTVKNLCLIISFIILLIYQSYLVYNFRSSYETAAQKIIWQSIDWNQTEWRASTTTTYLPGNSSLSKFWLSQPSLCSLLHLDYVLVYSDDSNYKSYRPCEIYLQYNQSALDSMCFIRSNTPAATQPHLSTTCAFHYELTCLYLKFSEKFFLNTFYNSQYVCESSEYYRITMEKLILLNFSPAVKISIRHLTLRFGFWLFTGLTITAAALLTGKLRLNLLAKSFAESFNVLALAIFFTIHIMEFVDIMFDISFDDKDSTQYLPAGFLFGRFVTSVCGIFYTGVCFYQSVNADARRHNEHQEDARLANLEYQGGDLGLQFAIY